MVFGRNLGRTGDAPRLTVGTGNCSATEVIVPNRLIQCSGYPLGQSGAYASVRVFVGGQSSSTTLHADDTDSSLLALAYANRDESGARSVVAPLQLVFDDRITINLEDLAVILFRLVDADLSSANGYGNADGCSSPENFGILHLEFSEEAHESTSTLSATLVVTCDTARGARKIARSLERLNSSSWTALAIEGVDPVSFETDVVTVTTEIYCGLGFGAASAGNASTQQCAACAVGMRSAVLAQGACAECPSGADCMGLGTVCPLVMPHYWRSPALRCSHDGGFDACLAPAQCLGNSTCAPGSSGVLCAKCNPGFCAWDGACYDCSENTMALVLACWGALCVVSIIALVRHISGPLLSEGDLDGLSGGAPPTPDIDDGRSVRSDASSLSSRSAKWGNMGGGQMAVDEQPESQPTATSTKIALSFVQALLILGGSASGALSLSTLGPTGLASPLAYIMGIASMLDVGAARGRYGSLVVMLDHLGRPNEAEGAVLYETELSAALIVPSAVLLLIGVSTLLAHVVARRHSFGSANLRRRIDAISTRAWQGVLLALSVMYPNMVRVPIALFSCRVVHLYAATDSTSFSTPPPTPLLLADTRLECYSNEWYELVPLASTAVAVYGIGVPALIFVLLHRHRTLPRWSRRLATVHLSYKPRFWWFEIFDLTRRLAQACGVTLFASWGAAAALSFSTLIAMLGLIVQLHLRPFRSPVANSIQATLLFLLSANSFGMLLLSAFADDPRSGSARSLVVWPLAVADGMALVVMVPLVLGGRRFRVFIWKHATGLTGNASNNASLDDEALDQGRETLWRRSRQPLAMAGWGWWNNQTQASGPPELARRGSIQLGWEGFNAGEGVSPPPFANGTNPMWHGGVGVGGGVAGGRNNARAAGPADWEDVFAWRLSTFRESNPMQAHGTKGSAQRAGGPVESAIASIPEDECDDTSRDRTGSELSQPRRSSGDKKLSGILSVFGGPAARLRTGSGKSASRGAMQMTATSSRIVDPDLEQRTAVESKRADETDFDNINGDDEASDSSSDEGGRDPYASAYAEMAPTSRTPSEHVRRQSMSAPGAAPVPQWIKDLGIVTLDGETIENVVEHANYSFASDTAGPKMRDSARSIRGIMIVTNFRIILHAEDMAPVGAVPAADETDGDASSSNPTGSQDTRSSWGGMVATRDIRGSAPQVSERERSRSRRSMGSARALSAGLAPPLRNTARAVPPALREVSVPLATISRIDYSKVTIVLCARECGKG